MDLVNLLGMTAGSLTTVAFIPQVMKTWKRKSGEDISGGTFFLFGTGVFLWLIYGLLVAAPPIVVANAVTFLLALLVLSLKYRYRNRK